ncbi:hypothetical protein [Duganella violaceipulchra]|uniref:Phytanoyl-CoA dioxygenase n=1 Tax=Duganella violaceipulchra TaxID=2849652 RepID=A0AA41L402_9BURK|nr:hypothetical protein [Duganella violaceicalia]MBV6324658.1 hypothetical protein [Duganella violaceicalia]MCP2009896.1 hypothetical protein [Duganella violaceicalia]
MTLMNPAAPPQPPLTVAKLRHDAEQFSYLQRLGVLGAEYSPIVQRYRQLADHMAANHIDKRERPTADQLAGIGDIYNRIIHRRATPAVQQTWSGSWQGADVELAYRSKPPGIVVIDDFLAPAALDSLRRFCLESTVWNSLRYSHGRLGALQRDGFNCPLLVQLAHELRRTLPRLIGERHPLTQLWAYKYPPHMPGDDVHADFAAINVNFWITPDDANLDPASGGMHIYDVEAPPDWDFISYNRRPDLIRRYLAEVGARARYVPYRQNRAVIFNSDLFHGTAACTFRDDYESRRINVTMLYGHRHEDDFRRPPPTTRENESTPYADWRSAALHRSDRRP